MNTEQQVHSELSNIDQNELCKKIHLLSISTKKMNLTVKFATCHLPTAAAITESVTIKSCKGHKYICKVRFLSQHYENHFVHTRSNLLTREGMLQEIGTNPKWFVTLSGSEFQGVRNPKWFLTLSG